MWYRESLKPWFLKRLLSRLLTFNPLKQIPRIDPKITVHHTAVVVIICVTLGRRWMARWAEILVQRIAEKIIYHYVYLLEFKMFDQVNG